MAGQVRDDLIEDIGELDFVFFTRHVADVRGANDVGHRQKWMLSVDDGLVFEDVDGGHAVSTLLQGIHKSAGFDQAGAAGVDDQGPTYSGLPDAGFERGDLSRNLEIGR